MTRNQQRATPQSSTWKIANDVRGAVDGWDSKQYVLVALFVPFKRHHFWQQQGS